MSSSGNPNDDDVLVEVDVILLLSNFGSSNFQQRANQERAKVILQQELQSLQKMIVTTHPNHRLRMTEIDGCDPSHKALRNALFATSGLRGIYPQLFLSKRKQNESSSASLVHYTYLGGIDEIEAHNDNDTLLETIFFGDDDDDDDNDEEQRGGGEDGDGDGGHDDRELEDHQHHPAAAVASSVDTAVPLLSSLTSSKQESEASSTAAASASATKLADTTTAVAAVEVLADTVTDELSSLNSSIPIIPFHVVLPSALVANTNTIAGGSSIGIEKGIVGSIIRMGTKSAMIWVGWGALTTTTTSSTTTNNDEVSTKDVSNTQASSFGKGLPMMGGLVLAMPRTKYKGAFGGSTGCSQLIGCALDDDDQMLANQMASRLSLRTNMAIYVSCQLANTAALLTTPNLEAAAAPNDDDAEFLSHRAAALADRKSVV